MSSHLSFTSCRTKIAAIGTPILLVVILFFGATFALSPVEARIQSAARTVLVQSEPTIISSVLQTSTTVFLPLVAHQSQDQNVAHHEVPPLHVMASSDRTGHSITPPPAANNHTFVADDGGHLDEYWFRSELPNGQLAFTIAITAPMVSLAHIYSDGLLTFPGLEYMHSRYKLSYTSLLQLHLWDVDHDTLGCAEIDIVSINGYRIEQNGLPVVLRSGDSTWDTWGIFFPTTFLRFPIGFLRNACGIRRERLDVDWVAMRRKGGRHGNPNTSDNPNTARYSECESTAHRGSPR
jgi:hypothetical protein